MTEGNATRGKKHPEKAVQAYGWIEKQMIHAPQMSDNRK
jgi:hypothetical protein